jgi:hypothetical protein
VTSRPTHSGFEPRTHDAERRDFFDLRRRLSDLEVKVPGGPWDFKGTIPTPGPPTTAQDPLPNADGDMWIDVNGIGWVWDGTTWVNVGSIKGPPGSTGPAGPQGPPGTGTDVIWIGPDDPIAANPTIELWYDTDASSGGGASGPISYVHNQGTASAMWQIIHNLGWYPNVTVIDSSNAMVEGEVIYVSVNRVDIGFSGGFTGVAYLS